MINSTHCVLIITTLLRQFVCSSFVCFNQLITFLHILRSSLKKKQRWLRCITYGSHFDPYSLGQTILYVTKSNAWIQNRAVNRCGSPTMTPDISYGSLTSILFSFVWLVKVKKKVKVDMSCLEIHRDVALVAIFSFVWLLAAKTIVLVCHKEPLALHVRNFISLKIN